jgi:radical SAM protein with 4Fe4S-binding SPASM domain
LDRWQVCYAARVWPFRRRSGPRVRAFRYEAFGGIVHLERPRALVFVDRDRARRLGYRDESAWRDDAPNDAPNDASNDARIDALIERPLSAPLEAHLQLTNRCTAGCQGCYTGATPEGARHEWGAAEWMRAIDALAERGVFHLALGGGESALLPWLGDIARHARARGLVPNLTTSGLYGEAELARLCEWAPLFGQINVSIDGVGAAYADVRGFDGFARADRAVIALRKVTRHVGINCVVTRKSFDALGDVFAYARRRKLREVELLRFKPSGRGTRVYEELRCTDAQHRALLPTVLALARKRRVRVRLDCSYTPMVAHHRVPRRLMQWLAIYGCAGGDLLVGAKASGALTACSFAPPVDASVDAIGDYWSSTDAFGAFRRWREAAAEPCRSCEYLALCRGGCRVVSAHVAGDPAVSDPECPRVVDWRAANPDESVRRRLPIVIQ